MPDHPRASKTSLAIKYNPFKENAIITADQWTDAFPHPIENCYWVLPGRFLAGEYPRDRYLDSSRKKLSALLRAGVTCFVDLTETRDGLAPYADLVEEIANGRISIRNFPIRDVSVPYSSDQVTEILDTMDEVIAREGMVYLHCWGGVGRTGTIVGCWLARHGYPGQAALSKLKELWSCCSKSRNRRSPETTLQENYVRNWQETASGALNRYIGSLLGLAAGDALGTTLEFKRPGSFTHITDITGGGPFGLKPGQWTDDTSMALCLAESLLVCQGDDPQDQMERYCRWWKEGYLSSNGRCFDIGGTVSSALSRFQTSGEPFAGSTDPYNAGNGSIMRLAPVPLYFAAEPMAAIDQSANSSRTTHGARTCLDACRYLAGLMVGALQGRPKEELLSPHFSPVPGLWDDNPLCPEIDIIAKGSFKTKKPPEIIGSGYVVHSLEAALWAFFHAEDFKEGAILAVNLGNDADTTGAVYGQLAGAFFGESGIPSAWRKRLVYKELITYYGGELYRIFTGKHTSPFRKTYLEI